MSANNPRLKRNSRGRAGRSCIRPAAGLRAHLGPGTQQTGWGGNSREALPCRRFESAASRPGAKRSGSGGRRDGAAVRADGVGRDHFRYKRGTAVSGPRDFLPDYASGTGAGRAPTGRSCTGGQKLRAAASTSPPRLRTASGLYAIFGIKSELQDFLPFWA